LFEIAEIMNVRIYRHWRWWSF